MIKDKILEILYQLGFEPELVDESFGYRFDFEGITFLFPPEEEETKTVYLSVPSIFDVTPDNRGAVLEAMAAIAGGVKFVQPAIVFDSVWLSYQHFLGENEPTPELLEHMIRALAYSTVKFIETINNDGNE